MADFKKEGNIDINQWRLFKSMFIDKFTTADFALRDPRNYCLVNLVLLYLKALPFTESF